MSSVKIVLDSDGIQELLKSEEMAEVCEREAERMTRATGMEYKSDVRVGKYRVRVSAYDKNADKKVEYPICPKCGVAHAHCRCKRG